MLWWDPPAVCGLTSFPNSSTKVALRTLSDSAIPYIAAAMATAQYENTCEKAHR